MIKDLISKINTDKEFKLKFIRGVFFGIMVTCITSSYFYSQNNDISKKNNAIDSNLPQISTASVNASLPTNDDVVVEERNGRYTFGESNKAVEETNDNNKVKGGVPSVTSSKKEDNIQRKYINNYNQNRRERVQQMRNSRSRSIVQRDYNSQGTRKMWNSPKRAERETIEKRSYDPNNPEKSIGQIPDYDATKNKKIIIKEEEVKPVLSEKELKEQSLLEKKRRLLTGNANISTQKGDIKATIRGNQIVKAGQTIQFLITEDSYIGKDVFIPKNSILTGIVSFGKYRVNAKIRSANVKNQIVNCNLEVYGLDGEKGIPTNINQVLDEAGNTIVKEGAREASKIPIVGGIFSGMISSSKKQKNISIEMINNQKVILRRVR